MLIREGLIDLNHLPSDIVPVSAPHTTTQYKRQDALNAIEAQAIRGALESNGGNRLAAAQQLGIHKSTLFRRVKLLGIDFRQKTGDHTTKHGAST